LVSISISSFRRNRNSDEFHPTFVEISMSKSEFRFWFIFRHRNLDSSIRISMPTSEFQFWHWISIPMSKFKNIFAEISQHFFFDCLSEFRFRLSKSKFRLLSIISTRNLCHFRRCYELRINEEEGAKNRISVPTFILYKMKFVAALSRHDDIRLGLG
jgi:hypothetical protein